METIDSPRPEPIRRRIVRRRQALELSQAELARRCACHQSQISRWEDGTNEPRGKAVAALAIALECNPGWLHYGVDP